MRSSADQKQWLFARGNSMRPFFRSGDLIVFVPCRVEDVRKGDVIIFIPPGQKERVVHRVISTASAGIRTKGDAKLLQGRLGFKTGGHRRPCRVRRDAEAR